MHMSKRKVTMNKLREILRLKEACGLSVQWAHQQELSMHIDHNVGGRCSSTLPATTAWRSFRNAQTSRGKRPHLEHVPKSVEIHKFHNR